MARTVRRRVVLLALLAALVVGPTASKDDHRPAPVVAVAAGTPDDLRSLVMETWDEFVGSFYARTYCIEPVTVEGAWTLDDRATYDPRRRVIAVRIPATAPSLRASLVHEFAHHVEFTCPAHEQLRPRFLRAQGLSSEASWFSGRAWEETPSEHFAEAASVFVLGERPGHLRIAVTPRALAVLGEWARGHAVTPPP